jgi:alanyl-tRNA synthetase
MGDAFPELIDAKDLITNTLETEEIKFKETLDRGMKILDQETEGLIENQSLDGKIAFKLYDTYGFPLDLTQDILKSKNIDVNIEEFDKEMKKQRLIARSSWKGSGDRSLDKFYLELENLYEPTNFIGYTNLNCYSNIMSIIDSNKFVNEVSEGCKVIVLLDTTPFYATSGGQISDIGSIENDKFKSQVLNCTKTTSGIYLHEINVNSGSLKIGDKVNATVNKLNRNLTACNHSSTHILHQALKDVLGNHIFQKGSLVNSEKLRFDFTHTNSISDDDLFEIETIINNKIRDNTEVLIREMDIGDSKKEGATALFGEKYGNLVRVVSMGDKLNKKKSFWSIELCGGTHVNKTGDIGVLKIINENSVSSGIRRIEAITGDVAVKLINNKYKIINNISQLLKTNEDSIIKKITSLNDDKKKIEKELNNLKNKNLSSVDQSDHIIKIGNIKFISKVLNNIPPNNLKGIVDNYLSKETNCVTALLSVDSKKISLVVGVTDNLSHKINAIDLVKVGSSIFGGKGGGGRPTMAQSGGSDINATQKTIDGLINYIKNID